MTDYSKFEQESTRSGTGKKTKICKIPFEFGELKGVRVIGTAGVIDKTSDNKRLVQEMICLLETCEGCPIALLYEASMIE